MNFRWGPVAIVLVLLHTQATAATLYMYGGNSFTEIIDGSPDGTYDTSMHVTGSFVLTHPLPANAESTDVTANVLTFSFSDGRNVISSQSSIDFSRFQFSTNASGAIDTWDILLSTALGLDVPQFQIGTGNIPAGDHSSIDFIVDGGGIVVCTQVIGSFCGGVDADVGRVRGHAGTWTTETVVPLPPSIGMMGLSLVGIALGRRRKHRGTLSNIRSRGLSQHGLGL